MKLIQIHKKEDFGTEYCVALLQGEKYSLSQFSVGWGDFSGGLIPYLYLTMGNGRLFDLLFCIGQFSFSFDLISPNWKWEHWEHEDT